MAREMTVTAILDANISKFLDGMNAAEGASSRLESNTTKAGGSMFKSFMGAQIGANLVTKAIGMVASGFGEITSEMNDNAKAWAMFEGNLKMIGQSDQEIARVKSSLQDFATETIYSASDMAQTYSQMAAIGVENAEKLVKGMGGLAASAENPAQAMKSLSTQMVQALSQPEMKWQDFRIMLEQAPAAMAQVAEHMGYSLDDLIGAIQDGEVASKDFAAAVAEVGTNADYQAMATEFKTMDQAMDGLTETLANKLAPGFDVINEIGINAISGIADAIDDIDFTPATNSLKRFGSWLGLIESPFAEIAETVAMTTEEIQSVADSWNDLSLDEKQAQVSTMGQEDLEELMQLMGVDFDSIPDEYTKNAYLNAYGKDALEELLWVTGKWHDLTLEEKAAVLKQQIDNDKILDVIEQRDLWNNAEFISQLAEINMNDDNALQQVVDLINYWGDLEGLEPVKLDVDSSDVTTAKEELENLSLEPKPFIDWNGWDTAIKNASEKMNTDIMNLINEFKRWDTAIANADLEVLIDVQNFRAQGWTEEQIQAEIDRRYGEGTYETQIALEPNVTVDSTKLSNKQLLETVKAWAGEKTIDVIQEVRANIEIYEGQNFNPERIQQLIDDKFGVGTYDLVTNIRARIGELESEGISGRALQRQINDEFGDNAYQIYMDVEPNVRLQQYHITETISIEDRLQEILSDPEISIEAKAILAMQIMRHEGTSEEQIQAYIEGQFGGGHYTLEPDISVAPKVIIGTGAGGSAGSAVGASGAAGVIEGIVKNLTPTTPIDMNVPLAPSFDFTSAIADVNSQMVAIQSVVQSRMQSIQNTVTAMMNGVNANFSSGMSQAQSTVQAGMAGVVSALNSASSSAYSAGVNVGSGFARGIGSQRGAVIAQAQSIADAASSAIQSALKIKSPSRVMMALGEFTGQGFVEGMGSMIDAVGKTANQFAINAIPNIPTSDMSYTSAINHTMQDNVANQNRLDDVLTAIQSQPIYVDMDGYRVGQIQRGYNNENLGTDARLTERWAF